MRTRPSGSSPRRPVSVRPLGARLVASRAGDERTARGCDVVTTQKNSPRQPALLSRWRARRRNACTRPGSWRTRSGRTATLPRQNRSLRQRSLLLSRPASARSWLHHGSNASMRGIAWLRLRRRRGRLRRASGVACRILYAGADGDDIGQAADREEPLHLILRPGEQQITPGAPGLLTRQDQRRSAAGADEL